MAKRRMGGRAGGVKRPRPRKPKPPAQELELAVLRLGRHGDGIAETDAGPVYVPGALAGERVAAEVRGTRANLLRVLDPSPVRAEPPCPHFGVCGGCAVQHLTEDAYRAWKRDLVVTALANRGLDAPVADLVDAHGVGRRRVTLHVRRAGSRVRVGFMRARSHELLEIGDCPILAPELAGAPEIAAELAAAAAPAARKMDVALTVTETGLDADLRGAGEPDASYLVQLSEIAKRYDLARLSMQGELIVERRRPELLMGDAPAVPPAGGFLQATKAGEATLFAAIVVALANAGRAIDLFCGIGPFSLRLAEACAVHGVDNDAAALAALDAAWRRMAGAKPVSTERRDLFESPIFADDLNEYDAAVFDPPRAGAEAQARELARSTVPVVIGVSCDPGTFARDAEILVQGGYRLERVTPVDQFKYAAHLEMVGIFRKG